MIIKNGLVFNKKGFFEKGSLKIYLDKIEAVLSDEKSDINDDVIDAEGLYVIPGLCDIHFHGCAGYDFCDGTHEAFEAMAEYQLKNGVTTICPASMTYDEERLYKIFRAASTYKSSSGAELVGINMEGPFISRDKMGAQNPRFIAKPDADMFYRLYDASGGLIKLCDIAPEIEGAMDFIKKVSRDVHISLAHTASDYDTAMRAFDAGADHVTHLYNAMNGFSHRQPGILGALVDNKQVFAELVGDGIHVYPPAMRLSLELLGGERVVTICDSMMACGLPNGEYQLGGQAVRVDGKLCTLSDGTIAGSVTNLMDCMRTLVRDMDVSLETAVMCAAVNPARSIGIFDQYGSLDEGKRANIVLLDKNLEIKSVIKDGRVVYSNDGCE